MTHLIGGDLRKMRRGRLAGETFGAPVVSMKWVFSEEESDEDVLWRPGAPEGMVPIHEMDVSGGDWTAACLGGVDSTLTRIARGSDRCAPSIIEARDSMGRAPARQNGGEMTSARRGAGGKSQEPELLAERTTCVDGFTAAQSDFRPSGGSRHVPPVLAPQVHFPGPSGALSVRDGGASAPGPGPELAQIGFLDDSGPPPELEIRGGARPPRPRSMCRQTLSRLQSLRSGVSPSQGAAHD